MHYIFGKDIPYKLYVYKDSEQITALPVQDITAYVFRNQPSREDAEDGTGALATIDADYTAEHAGVIQFTIPAIDDPEPTVGNQIYSYWIAIKYILTTGEQEQVALRELSIARASVKDSTAGVTIAKITSIYPDINQYLSNDEISEIISMADLYLTTDLKNKGYSWAQIHAPDQLFNALLFKTLELLYASQVQRLGDKFAFLYEQAKAGYIGTISNLRLDLDNVGSGLATEKSSGLGVLMGIR